VSAWGHCCFGRLVPLLPRRRGRVTVIAAVALIAAGCSWSGPQQRSDVPPTGGGWASWGEPAGGHELSRRPAAQAVSLATDLIGTPYRWGGATPAGFDCSGLVYYTFRKAGLDVPRTSLAQYRAARPVPIARAMPGDLVFFGRRGKITHVGIYLGDERFVHAPETGRSVSIAHLSDRYYRTRFAGAGRIH
jgi:cell wall-associated NlpC family hydrolase